MNNKLEACTTQNDFFILVWLNKELKQNGNKKLNSAVLNIFTMKILKSYGLFNLQLHDIP